MKCEPMTMCRYASVLAVALSVAACGTAGGSACDGWRRIPLAAGTAVYLAREDRPAGEAIASHNEHGHRLCGWKNGGF